MKFFSPSVRYSTLLFFFLLTACGPLQETVNPYNENFKCRARDDAGECIDTPAAYKKARYPEPASGDEAEPATGITQEIRDNRYRLVAGLLGKRKSHFYSHRKSSGYSCFPTRVKMMSCS